MREACRSIIRENRRRGETDNCFRGDGADRKRGGSMLKIGSVIGGKYKILSVIGRGGMSVVYLALNEAANKPWAVKELLKKEASGAGGGPAGD